MSDNDIFRSLGRIEGKMDAFGEDIKEMKENIKEVKNNLTDQVQTIQENCNVHTDMLKKSIDKNTQWREKTQYDIKWASKVVAGVGIVITIVFNGLIKLVSFLLSIMGGRHYVN